jgi:hypothetical protein
MTDERIELGSADRSEFHGVAEALGITTAEVTAVLLPDPENYPENFRAIYTDDRGQYLSQWLGRDHEGVLTRVGDPQVVPDFIEKLGGVTEKLARAQDLEQRGKDLDAKLAWLRELRESVGGE